MNAYEIFGTVDQLVSAVGTAVVGRVDGGGRFQIPVSEAEYKKLVKENGMNHPNIKITVEFFP